VENNHIPEIRFNDFSGRWKHYKLGGISDITIGEFVIKTKQNPDNPYPVYNGGISFTGFYDEYNNKGPKIVISARGANAGFVNYLEGYYWAGNSCYSVGVLNGSDFDIKFLYHYLKYNQHLFTDYQQTANIPSVSKKDVEKFDIRCPNYKQQKDIALLFNKLDDLIAVHQQELETLKKTKQGFLQKMFPKEGETLPEVRFSGFEEEWKIKKLINLADFSKGSGYSKKDLVEEGTPILLYGQLYTNYNTVISDVSNFVLEKKNSIVSSGNEVVVPASGETSNDIARASAITKPGIIIGGDLNVIVPVLEIDPIFLALALSNGRVQKELSKLAQGKSVVHLQNSEIKKVDLMFPGLNEQQKIGEFFKKLDLTIELQEKELEALKETKKAFLQKMFV